MRFTAISWNLFHGRDFPPGPALRTWRSRLLRVTERNETHVQVNRDLLPEFTRLLVEAEWDVALLQECPPRWWDELAAACKAEAHGVLTSRNSFGALRALAARLNPDLVASVEGGSNLTLVRRPGPPTPSAGTYASNRGINHSRTPGEIVERREMTIHEGRPERRAMAFTRIDLPGIGGSGARGDRAAGGGASLCVANLHATAGDAELASEDVLRAARAATEWAGDSPLLFGGDLNLRPARSAAIFAGLRDRFGLTAPTAPDAIDHLLARGLEIVEPPHLWPPERRELREDGLALRLSDHAPVKAVLATLS